MEEQVAILESVHESEHSHAGSALATVAVLLAAIGTEGVVPLRELVAAALTTSVVIVNIMSAKVQRNVEEWMYGRKGWTERVAEEKLWFYLIVFFSIC